MIPFFVFLFCLFATYGTYLLITRKTAEQRAKVNKRLADLVAFSGVSVDPAVQIAREDRMSEVPLFSRLLGNQPLATKLKLMIEQPDLQLTVTKLILFPVLAGTLDTLAAAVITPFLGIQLLVGAIAACLPYLHVLWKRKKRLNRFLADLPDALELMGRALAAGHAFTE